MPVELGTALVISAGATAGAAAYSAHKQSSAQEKAQKKQEAIAAAERELMEKQAGEYYDLSRKQMEFQAQASNISTLADLLEKTNRPATPQIYTLPAAKIYTPTQKINMAIDEFFKGFG